MKRVQLSFSKKGNNILTSLETHNRKLRELLDSNEKLESVKASQKDTTWANIFDCIRKHANSIHAAIRTGFCCTCTNHAASLRLEQRKTGEWTSNFNLAFSVLDSSKADAKFRREVTLKVRQCRETPAMKIKSPQQTKKVEYGTMLDLRTQFESKSSPQLDQSLGNPRPILSPSLSASSGHSSRTKFRDRFSKSVSSSINSNGTEYLMEELKLTS